MEEYKASREWDSVLVKKKNKSLQSVECYLGKQIWQKLNFDKTLNNVSSIYVNIYISLLILIEEIYGLNQVIYIKH